VLASRERGPAAPVIEQRVDGFLKHALFVAHDDVRGARASSISFSERCVAIG